MPARGVARQFLWVAAWMALCGPATLAQTNSNPAAVNLLAVINPQISVVASPGTVNFALVPNGTANGDVPITITTSWALRPNIGFLALWGSFASAPAALTSGFGNNIPSSSVRGSVNGGAFAPFTGLSPFGIGTSRLIFLLRILGNNRNSTRNDTLNLQIDTTGLGLPPGTYTGILRLQAVAI